MSTICRTCLQMVKSPEAISLFQIYKQKYKLVDILKQMICIKIEFDDDDNTMCSKSICEHCANQLIAFQSFADMVIISDQKLREPTFDPTIQNDKLMVEPNVTYEIRNKQHTVFLNMPVENIGLAEETVDDYENVYGQDDYSSEDAAEMKPNLAISCESIDEKNSSNRLNRGGAIRGGAIIDRGGIKKIANLSAGSAEFRCSMCSAIFQNTRGLHKHERNIHSKISLQCELCPKTFKNRDNLTKHKNKMHPNWRSILPPLKVEYKCKEVDCNKKFSSLQLISLHHRKDHATRLRRAAINKIEIRQRRQPQFVKMHMCREDNCKQRFTSLKKLRLHRRITGHRNSEPSSNFKCATCTVIFSSSDEYASHRLQHLNNEISNKFQCIECLKEFDQLSTLLQHCSVFKHPIDDKYGYSKCAGCQKYYHSQALKRHIRRKHPNYVNCPEFELLQNNQYICKWCNERFGHYETYLAHRREHIESQSNNDSPNEYYCIACTKTYSDFEQLLRHCNKFQHELNKIYKQPAVGCTLCSRHYQSDKSLRRHMRQRHANAEVLRESIGPLGDEFETEPHTTSVGVQSIEEYEHDDDQNDDSLDDALKQPSSQKTTGVATEIPIISEMTGQQRGDDEIDSSSRDIYKETKSSINDSMFECSICDTIFQTARYLQRHKAYAHSNVSFECELCPEVHRNRDNLTRHKNKKHPNWREILKKPKHNWNGEYRWECGTCNVKFRTRNLRRAHYHETKHNARPANESPRDYICDYCNKLFKTRRKIRAHITRHFKPKTPGLCNECGSLFNCANKMKEHQRRVHLKIRRPLKLECSICFKLFSQKNKLTEHENRHKNIRNENCEHCAATFVTKAGLRQHVTQVHIGIRRHVCPICSKGFQIKGNLTAHMFVHSEMKPHHCPNCNQGFARKYKMMHHLQTCTEIPQDEDVDSLE